MQRFKLDGVIIFIGCILLAVGTPAAGQDQDGMSPAASSFFNRFEQAAPASASDLASDYVAQAQEKVAHYWTPPADLTQAGPPQRTVIRVTLDRWGQVIQTQPLVPSDSRPLREAALQAIHQAAPFGSLPPAWDRLDIVFPFETEPSVDGLRGPPARPRQPRVSKSPAPPAALSNDPYYSFRGGRPSANLSQDWAIQTGWPPPMKSSASVPTPDRKRQPVSKKPSVSTPPQETRADSKVKAAPRTLEEAEETAVQQVEEDKQEEFAQAPPVSDLGEMDITAFRALQLDEYYADNRSPLKDAAVSFPGRFTQAGAGAQRGFRQRKEEAIEQYIGQLLGTKKVGGVWSEQIEESLEKTWQPLGFFSGKTQFTYTDQLNFDPDFERGAAGEKRDIYNQSFPKLVVAWPVRPTWTVTYAGYSDIQRYWVNPELNTELTTHEVQYHYEQPLTSKFHWSVFERARRSYEGLLDEEVRSHDIAAQLRYKLPRNNRLSLRAERSDDYNPGTKDLSDSEQAWLVDLNRSFSPRTVGSIVSGVRKNTLGTRTDPAKVWGPEVAVGLRHKFTRQLTAEAESEWHRQRGNGLLENVFTERLNVERTFNPRLKVSGDYEAEFNMVSDNALQDFYRHRMNLDALYLTRNNLVWTGTVGAGYEATDAGIAGASGGGPGSARRGSVVVEKNRTESFNTGLSVARRLNEWLQTSLTWTFTVESPFTGRTNRHLFFIKFRYLLW